MSVQLKHARLDDGMDVHENLLATLTCEETGMSRTYIVRNCAIRFQCAHGVEEVKLTIPRSAQGTASYFGVEEDFFCPEV